MAIIHRKQQNHGVGVTAHPKERTCSGCKEIFKSKLGLKSHQSRVSNPRCHRAGILRIRANYVTERNVSWKQGLITGHNSVYVMPNSKGFAPQSKQICLNVYQKIRDKGIGVYEVCNNDIGYIATFKNVK